MCVINDSVLTAREKSLWMEEILYWIYFCLGFHNVLQVDCSAVECAFSKYWWLNLGYFLWLFTHSNCQETRQESVALPGALKINRVVHRHIPRSASIELPETQRNHLEFTLHRMDWYTNSLRCVQLSWRKTIQTSTKTIYDPHRVYCHLRIVCCYCNKKFSKRQRKRSKRCNPY